MGAVANAWGIPEIQEYLCSNLSVVQLFNARLINSQFNHIASKQLSQAYKGVQLFRNNKELTSFLEVMQKRIQYQVICTRYKIHVTHLSNDLVTQFSSNIGPHVTMLTLEDNTGHWSLPRDNEKNKIKHIQVLASTRQLKYLTVQTHSEIKLTPEEQNSLAHLQVQTLNVQFTYKVTGETQKGEDGQNIGMSLGLFLILNSKLLKKVSVPIKDPNNFILPNSPNIEFIKEIKSKVKSPIRYVLPYGQLCSGTLAVFQQLDQLALKFCSIGLYAWNYTPEQLEFLTQWIEKQENFLEELNIELLEDEGEDPVMTQFYFPTLNRLKTLTLCFSGTVFAPIGPGQIPNLNQLTLERSDGFGVFSFPLPKLAHMEFRETNYWNCFTCQWHRIAPNLKSLRIELLDTDAYAATKVSYLLTSFPQLEELQINIEGDQLQGVDLWDVLTGNAPRVRDKQVLNFDSPNTSYRPQETQISSLGNLKRLRKLTFGVGNWTNLQAILFLTATGAIPPLEVLEISGRLCYMKEHEAYRCLLMQVHGKVKIRANN